MTGVPTASLHIPSPHCFSCSLLFQYALCTVHTGYTTPLVRTNPFRGNLQILHRLQYCLQPKNFTVPRVACKEKCGSMQVFESSKIFKRGLSVNSSFDIYISSSLDLSKTLSLRCLTQAESCSQSSHLE